MNRDARNDEQVRIGREQAAFDAAVRAHHDAAGHRKRLVEPGMIHDAAVRFNVQAQVTGRTRDFRAGLHLVGWRIGMRCRQLVVVVIERGANLEGDDAGVVAHRVVAAATFDVPRLAFGQVCETRRVQTRPQRRRRMEGARAGLDEVEHGLGAACLPLVIGSANARPPAPVRMIVHAMPPSTRRSFSLATV